MNIQYGILIEISIVIDIIYFKVLNWANVVAIELKKDCSVIFVFITNNGKFHYFLRSW